MKMESLQQRREELERKEYQLKESLLKFDKFLKVLQWQILLISGNGTIIGLKVKSKHSHQTNFSTPTICRKMIPKGPEH